MDYESSYEEVEHEGDGWFGELLAAPLDLDGQDAVRSTHFSQCRRDVQQIGHQQQRCCAAQAQQPPPTPLIPAHVDTPQVTVMSFDEHHEALWAGARRLRVTQLCNQTKLCCAVSAAAQSGHRSCCTASQSPCILDYAFAVLCLSPLTCARTRAHTGTQSGMLYTLQCPSLMRYTSGVASYMNVYYCICVSINVYYCSYGLRMHSCATQLQ
jgi:hypothetical protein